MQDNISTYCILLSKVNLKSLYTKRLRKFLIILYKSLFNSTYPRYIRSMFTLRDALCRLRGNYILSLPRSKTTTYGLHSFSYLAAKLWNSLPDIYRTSASLVCVCMCVCVCMYDFTQILRTQYTTYPCNVRQNTFVKV